MRTAIAAVVAVVIVAVLAVVISRHSTSSAASETSFTLPVLTGTGKVSLSEFRGEPTVVTLFASWCTACQAELPDYAKVASSLRGKVHFVGVDAKETGDGVAFADMFHLSQAGFVLARDVNDEAFTAYAARGLPLTAIYNNTGKLIGRYNEALTAAQLTAYLAPLT